MPEKWSYQTNSVARSQHQTAAAPDQRIILLPPTLNGCSGMELPYLARDWGPLSFPNLSYITTRETMCELLLLLLARYK